MSPEFWIERKKEWDNPSTNVIIVNQIAPNGARKICKHLEADKYHVTLYPEQAQLPCQLKRRHCNEYDKDCTLDPSPIISLNCKNCSSFEAKS